MLASTITRNGQALARHVALNDVVVTKTALSRMMDLSVWVRDEWSGVSEKTVREDAQVAGVESPVVFVFLPQVGATDLRETIARAGAARHSCAA